MKNAFFQRYLKRFNFPKVSIVSFGVNMICVVGVAFFAVNIFNVIGLGIERYNLIQSEINKLETLKSQELQLRADLIWFSSLDFIESQSRDNLNLANEGDSIVVIPEGIFGNVTEIKSEDDKIETVPDMRNWLKLIF